MTTHDLKTPEQYPKAKPGHLDPPADGKPLPVLQRPEAQQSQEAQPTGIEVQNVDEKSRGGVHTLYWKDSNLTVKVSKLRETSNGDLRGDFDVKGQRIPPFTYFTRINLKSGSTRASTAKDVSGRAKGYIGDADTWRWVIEYVCNYVRSAFNEGEAGVELIDSEASEDTEYRLWPFLEEGQASMIFGHGASGKSYFGVLAGYLIATGREHLGMKPRKGNVCYLDYETDEGTTKRRLGLIARGFGETIPPFFHYMHMRRPIEDDFDRVNAYLLEHSIEFVILDSAARAVVEAEISGAANQYFNVMSGLEATTLTIAHVSKAGKEHEPFGSTFWFNGPRGLYRVFGSQTGSVLSIALRNVKYNNGPVASDEKAYDFTFGDNAAIVSEGNANSIPAVNVNPPMHRRILTYLATNGGPVTAAHLANTHDSTPAYIRLVLNRELRGKVVNLPDGRWGLSVS